MVEENFEIRPFETLQIGTGEVYKCIFFWLITYAREIILRKEMALPNLRRKKQRDPPQSSKKTALTLPAVAPAHPPVINEQSLNKCIY